MTNPYAAPVSRADGKKEPGQLPSPQEPGLAGHIRVVAVLMMIQGFFEVAFGGILTVMAFVFPAALAAMAAADPQAQQEGGPDPQTTARMVMIMYLAMGLGGVIPGLLHMAAGFRNALYKGRIFGIVALGLGIGTAPLIFCLPTAALLAVYGMVIYFHPSSAKVFEMGEQGYSPEAIYATFFAGRVYSTPASSDAPTQHPLGEGPASAG